jgi:CelD/BcsL family acetyltransferase involved in cellulose biosynthesis
MPLTMSSSPEAERLLADDAFRAQWTRLYQSCPWATVLQAPGFVASWFEFYKKDYRLLFVCEFSPRKELIGFLPVAIPRNSNRAVLPGAQQAEYKTWLALPSNGGSFPGEALKLLAGATAIGALSFRYLPPGVPLAGLPRGGPWILEAEEHTRAVIRLSNATEVAGYLRQKTNSTLRNSRNRLQRMGNLRLERIHEAAALAPIFDELIDWYDTRQGSAHGKKAFEQDDNKKAWHLRLLQEGLLHVTVLKLDAEVISAAFGMADGKTYSLAMPMFSPAHARYSPMALHFLFLVEQLQRDGYLLLDLTPGPDPFKERFGAEFERVSTLSIYFKRREWVKAEVRRQSRAMIKAALSPLGLAPSSLSRGAQWMRALLRRRKRAEARPALLPQPPGMPR